VKDSGNQKKLTEVNNCRGLVELAEQELEKAVRELRNFNAHQPEERIAICEKEISQL
jgi:hypothetical protein